MKNKNLFLIVSTSALIFLAGLAGDAWAITVQKVDLSGIGRNSEIEIQGSAPLFFSQDKSASKDQIVLKVQGELGAKVARQIDGSAFEFSPVKQVSSYPDPDNAKESKVVIQLQKEVDEVDVHQEGNTIKVRIPNNHAPNVAAIKDALKVTSAAADTDAVTDPLSDPSAPSAPDAIPDPIADSAPLPPAEKPAGKVHSVEPDASVANAAPEVSSGKAAATMDEFIKNRDSRTFTGRPISLKVKDADLVDVFRLVGETSGFNIVISDSVKGKLTMNMEGVPWDQVLDVILRTHQLGAERNGNLLRITTLADLTNEKTQELNARKANEAITPKVTKIFSVSYANIDDLSKVLTGFTQANSANGQGGSGSPAIVQTDKRTNSIIVRDTTENLEKMKKLIELLDTQTPQVMIEAKIIEASEGFSKDMNGAIGLGHVSDGGKMNWLGGFNASNPGGSLTGDPLTAQGADTAASGIFGYSPKIGGFLSGLTATAILKLAESENNAKVISSPKTVVLDHESASILQTQPVTVTVPAPATATGGGGTSTEVKDAKLSMTVTPSVTNEGSVLMQLSLSRDDPQPSVGGGNAVAQRNMSTRVIVDSGSTLVIGGIYTYKTTFEGFGLPFLRKLPLIGALFGSENSKTIKNELLFFITPRILNPREAGLNG